MRAGQQNRSGQSGDGMMALIASDVAWTIAAREVLVSQAVDC